MAIKDLRLLTAITIAMVVVVTAWGPIVLATAGIAPLFFRAQIMPVAGRIDSLQLVFLIATYIVFSMWIYRAGANLAAANFDDLDFTPGSRIWWFAVPVASLFKPFQGMRELWNASHHRFPYDENVGIVSLWWGCWLFHSFASGVEAAAARSGAAPAGIMWLQEITGIAVAVPAILLLRGIATAQRTLDRSDLAEVFA